MAEDRFNPRAGEAVRLDPVGPPLSLVPNPLPPELSIDAPLLALLERANHALGQLDAISSLLPNPEHLLYTFVRMEAVLSSRIEGTQSSLADLLAYEQRQAVSVDALDVREVSNYVRALTEGVAQVKSGVALDTKLIESLHAVLLQDTRGSDQLPGQLRTRQNWIGGDRPEAAVFVPPPAQYLPQALEALWAFVELPADQSPYLVRTALTHYQFETLHPFLDGNGRLGRLLVTLQLCRYGLLQEPLLLLSLYFKRNRLEYYTRLQRVRTHGEWEEWVSFFSTAVQHTAIEAYQLAQAIVRLFDQDREAVRTGATASVSAVLVVLQQKIYLSPTQACIATGLSFPQVSQALKKLEQIGIAKETTGYKRNRVYCYRRYLEMVSIE